MIAATILSLIPAALPAQGPLTPDRVDTYERVLDEYKKAGLDWRRAKRQAKKDGTLDAFDQPHPVETFFARFAVLAEAGDPDALLWTGLNVEDLGRTAGEVAELKRSVFARLIEEFPGETAVKSLVDRLEAQDEWLTDAEIIGFLSAAYERTPLEAAKASAAYRLGRRFEVQGDEAGLAQAQTWYETVVAKYASSREARKAEGRLNGLKTAVGRMAPDFDAVDVDGNAFKLSDYRGKVTVIDFWGFW